MVFAGQRFGWGYELRSNLGFYKGYKGRRDAEKVVASKLM